MSSRADSPPENLTSTEAPRASGPEVEIVEELDALDFVEIDGVAVRPGAPSPAAPAALDATTVASPSAGVDGESAARTAPPEASAQRGAPTSIGERPAQPPSSSALRQLPPLGLTALGLGPPARTPPPPPAFAGSRGSSSTIRPAAPSSMDAEGLPMAPAPASMHGAASPTTPSSSKHALPPPMTPGSSSLQRSVSPMEAAPSASSAAAARTMLLSPSAPDVGATSAPTIPSRWVAAPPAAPSEPPPAGRAASPAPGHARLASPDEGAIPVDPGSEPIPERTVRLARSEVFRVGDVAASSNLPVAAPLPPPETSYLGASSGGDPSRGVAPSIAPVEFELPRSAPVVRSSSYEAGEAPGPVRAAATEPSRSPVLLGAAVALGMLLLGGAAATVGYLAGHATKERAAAVGRESPNERAAAKREESVATNADGTKVEDIRGAIPAPTATPETRAASVDRSAREGAPPTAPVASSDVGSLPSAPIAPPSNAPLALANTAARPPAAAPVAPAGAPLPGSAPMNASAPPAVASAAVVSSASGGPAAAPLPPPTPARAASAPVSTVGVVRVPVSSSIITIVVDGRYRRVENGAVAVTCGRHTVRVGLRQPRVVDVPCGGSVYVD